MSRSTLRSKRPELPRIEVSVEDQARQAAAEQAEDAQPDPALAKLAQRLKVMPARVVELGQIVEEMRRVAIAAIERAEAAEERVLDLESELAEAAGRKRA